MLVVSDFWITYWSHTLYSQLHKSKKWLTSLPQKCLTKSLWPTGEVKGQICTAMFVPLQLHLQEEKSRKWADTGARKNLKPWFSRKIIFHLNVAMRHKIYKKWTLKMCICMFTLLQYVFHTHADLWDSTPPHPVVRHVCARLTDLSSNQTSFSLHLTPSPREQPPQWRSPGNHPLISEVSVCIIVFTLSSDT